VWKKSHEIESSEAVGYAMLIPMADVLLAGIALMVGDALRDKSGKTENALFTLPLAKREVAVVVWAPTALVSSGVLLFGLLPSCVALTGFGVPFPKAISEIASAYAVGLTLASVSHILAYGLMRGPRWDSVRFPVASLIWLALLLFSFWGSYRTLFLEGNGAWLFLLLPLLLLDLLVGEIPISHITILSCLAAVSCLFVVMVASSQMFSRRERYINRPWKGRGGWLGRVAGELRYTLRNVSATANILVSLISSGALVICVKALPGTFREPVAELGLYLVVLLGCAPVRTFRSLFPLRVPIQRIIGMSPTSWVLSQQLMAAIVSALATAPAIALLFDIRVDGSEGLAILFSAWCAGLALANLLGILIVVGSDNAVGQAIASVALVMSMGVWFGGVESIFEGFTAARFALTMLLCLVSIAVSVMVERSRWRAPAAQRVQESDRGNRGSAADCQPALRPTAGRQ
jgi:hypothetical protein